MRWRFAVKFLLAFAAVIVAWWALSLGEVYRDALHWTAGATSPLLTGWWLDTRAVATGGRAVFRFGADEIPLWLNLPVVAMSLMPLFSLLVATPGQSLKQLLLRLPVAIVACVAIHTAVVLAYPWIMHEPNALKDTVGVFSGLVAFVVTPLGVWFALTYPTLRSLWGFDGSGRGGAVGR